MADEGDNFSDGASNLELLVKAKSEFNREKRLVVRNLPPTTSEKEIRAFMGFNGEFPIEEVTMIKQQNQAIVTLKDQSIVDDAISKLDNTELDGLIVSVIKYHSDKILCIAHLPSTLTEYQFRELAAQHGNMDKCFLMRAEDTGESKGYGFVEYNEAIETVGQIKVKVDGSNIRGHIVHCDALTDSSQRGISFHDLHSKCLIIDNLPKEYKDSIELRELFSTLVKPVYCQIVTKEGESLGFGIIEYDCWEEAEKAYKKFNKHKINDVEINLSFCIPGKSAVHMFTRIMFKFGDRVHINRASLLPDPVYPNPAFLKHVFFKTHNEKHPKLLVQFTDSLLHLQDGYVRQLEDRTNTKPGLLGPAPSIPMSPLMDMNLQLGLLSLILLDMKEKGTYTGEMPEPLGKVKIPTEEEFQQKNEPVSLLGDPLTAQANIILRNILMPDAKQEIGTDIADLDAAKLLGKPVKCLNLVYLCSFGRLMGMLSDRNHSAGILGSRPDVQVDTGGPKPLIEGLMQAGKVAQSLLNSMGMGQQQQNQNNALMNQDLGNIPSLLANSGNAFNSTNNAAANFVNTIQSLALQKLSNGGGPQLLNALFGNKSNNTGGGLLGDYQGQGQGQSNQPQSQPQSLFGKGPPKPLLGTNITNNTGDGLLPIPSKKDDGSNDYLGNQGNYDDSGYQGGYDDYNDGYGNYGNSSSFNRNYSNNRGKRGDAGSSSDSRFGARSDNQSSSYGNQNQTKLGKRRFGQGTLSTTDDDNENTDDKEYNTIAQQAAAYAAGAAAAYKQQYDDYMAHHGYGSGYGSGYGDGYQNYGSDYNYDYGSTGSFRGENYAGSSSGSYSSGMSGSKSSYGSYSGYNSSSGYSSNSGYGSGGYTSSTGSTNNMANRQSYNSSASNTRTATAGSSSLGTSYSASSSGYGGLTSGYSGSSSYGSGSGNSYGSGGGNSYGSGVGNSYGSSTSSYGVVGSGYDGQMSRDSRLGKSTSSGNMGPPLPPGTGRGPSLTGMSTPQGQKRTSMHMIPSPEPSPEGDYIGQHSQGIGGHYADTYSKRQKLAGKF